MTAVNTSESIAGLTRLQLENWERAVKARDDELLAAPTPEHVDLPPPRKYVEIGRPVTSSAKPSGKSSAASASPVSPKDDKKPAVAKKGARK